MEKAQIKSVLFSEDNRKHENKVNVAALKLSLMEGQSEPMIIPQKPALITNRVLGTSHMIQPPTLVVDAVSNYKDNYLAMIRDQH